MAEQPANLYMTEKRLRILRSAEGEAGVVGMPYLTGFEAVSWKRSTEFLCDRGLLKRNAHGDFYITDLGRQFVEAFHHG
jgi:predicted transcriptional regulator